MIQRSRTAIYTAESQLRHPIRLFREMFIDLLSSRELAWRLFIRNISAQYRQTMLGYVWVFLPPIVTTMTFMFLNSQKILHVADTAVPYPAYVMVGTLLWQVFVDALNSPIKLMILSKEMLVKVNFPREALILAGIAEVVFNFLVRAVLFVVVFVWFKIPFSLSVLLAPVGILSLIMFGIVIGVLVTPLAVLYRDIERSIMIMVSLWFFLTPIVYPTPKIWPASLLAKLNPVCPLLVTTREWIFGGILTQLGNFYLVSAITLLFHFIGWIIYRVAMPHIIARIGS